MKFILFHGAFGGPEGNWFPQLKEKLESFGQEVVSPQFPVEVWDGVTKKGPNFPPQKQTLKNWLASFEKSVLPKLNKKDKLCFVGHSLGAVFILHLADKYKLQLDSAIFVSPFMSELNKLWQFDHVNKSFYKANFDFTKLKNLIPLSYVLYSDNDPYVDKKLSLGFAENLKSSPILVTRAGHLNSEVNLNELPLVLELCKTRLDLTLYQKYLDHRRELFSIDYVKNTSEEVIYLQPDEVYLEGIFHFRNLRRYGFCTFFTRGIKFWNTQAKYYQEARKAARRMGNLSRVFVVENKEDLKNKRLLEQIKLDLESNIKVYLCRHNDVKDKIPEPDFGIWDDDYLCIVHFEKNNKVGDIKLSSRKKDITESYKWRDEVLKHAVRIHKATDVNTFLHNHS